MLWENKRIVRSIFLCEEGLFQFYYPSTWMFQVSLQLFFYFNAYVVIMVSLLKLISCDYVIFVCSWKEYLQVYVWCSSRYFFLSSRLDMCNLVVGPMPEKDYNNLLWVAYVLSMPCQCRQSLWWHQRPVKMRGTKKIKQPKHWVIISTIGRAFTDKRNQS